MPAAVRLYFNKQVLCLQAGHISKNNKKCLVYEPPLPKDEMMYDAAFVAQVWHRCPSATESYLTTMPVHGACLICTALIVGQEQMPYLDQH